MAKRKTEKPQLFLVRKGEGFVAETNMDVERIAMEYPYGHTYKAILTRPRSLPRLRLYWAIMHFLHANDRFGYASPEKISDALKIECGISTPTMRLGTGEIVVEADSIAFDKMGEEAFGKYFNKAIEIASHHWGIDIDDMMREGKRLNAKVYHFPNTSKDSGNPYQQESANVGIQAAEPQGADRGKEENSEDQAAD